jgi:hypothetical protein
MGVARGATASCYARPEAFVRKGLDLLIDALACALAGWRGEDTDKVIRFAQEAPAPSRESRHIDSRLRPRSECSKSCRTSRS